MRKETLPLHKLETCPRSGGCVWVWLSPLPLSQEGYRRGSEKGSRNDPSSGAASV